jgi:uncharacterized membrane-anchored protein YhcB (DUF1043 family)
MIECFEENQIVQAEKPADEPAKTNNSTELTGWRLALAIIIPVITIGIIAAFLFFRNRNNNKLKAVETELKAIKGIIDKPGVEIIHAG